MHRTTLFLCGLLAVAPVLAEDVGNTPENAKRTSAKSRGVDTLSSSTDIDFYRFDVRQDKDNPGHDTSGNLTVNFSQETPPGANAKSGWRLDLYTEKDLGNSLFSVILPETSLEVEFEQGLSSGRYYYKVSSLDDTVFPTAEYTLRGYWEENANYEKAQNDSLETATALKANEVYYGNLSSMGDVDFYRLSLETPDIVTITLNQEIPGIDETVGWRLSLFSPTLPQQEVIDVPLTRLSGTIQVNLGIGVHYLFVKAMSQEGEAGNQSANQALIGKRYQIIANAATVPAPPLESDCPFSFTYAQNPATGRWITAPTLCDVPTGWHSQPVPPEDFEACPSAHATYTPSVTEDDGTKIKGKLKIPLLELTDNSGNEVLYRVEMNQEKMLDSPEGLLFHFLISEAKMIRVLE
ncbi:hypothetical protein [Candidatus Parabeggiatoa sp. HSG14]|uniref:hypothetical protein n=1 Tax=Candidatus Parabeggiatoa sp. HSG14 TaxID=3055593 RepID=UPI0025A7A5AA|nr:hypothetical protein [Thiotrichales bacterium HSG14]